MKIQATAVSTPPPVIPEHYNIAEAQDKDIKITCTNRIEGLKKEMSKSMKEIFDNTNSERK